MDKYQSKVCIVGAGISGVMAAAKLAEKTNAEIILVDAGRTFFNLEQRFELRDRFLKYGENPWPGDYLIDFHVPNANYQTMAVGGSSLHWNGKSLRFSASDFELKTAYGVGYDWPFKYRDIEPFYCEAERRMGVAGDDGFLGDGGRSEPYPMPATPLNYNLRVIKRWARSAGIEFWSRPVAKNTIPYDDRNICMRCDTCYICPIGAKYSPDFTLEKLLKLKRVKLLPGVFVKSLECNSSGQKIVAARGHQFSSDRSVEISAENFILACGVPWTTQLLLASRSRKHPAGVGNARDEVGRYYVGHRSVKFWVEIPERLYPGMHVNHGLESRQFMDSSNEYVRFSLGARAGEYGRRPKYNKGSKVLLGDEIMTDWRERTKTGCVEFDSYYDMLPDRESRITLGPSNALGVSTPKIRFVAHKDSQALREKTLKGIRSVGERLVDRHGGSILAFKANEMPRHPVGGCRMGDDPSSSVCDGSGRVHDLDNLMIAGASACLTASCTHGTLTFAAQALKVASDLASKLS